MTTRTVFLIFDDGKTFKFVLKKKTPAVRLVQKVATTRGLDPGACSLERVGLAVADDEDVALLAERSEIVVYLQQVA